MAVLNKKEFLAQESVLSSAMIHVKIKDNLEVQIRISDCNKTIKLWNNLNNEGESKEMIGKIDTIISNLEKLKDKVLECTHKPDAII